MRCFQKFGPLVLFPLALRIIMSGIYPRLPTVPGRPFSLHTRSLSDHRPLRAICNHPTYQIKLSVSSMTSTCYRSAVDTTSSLYVKPYSPVLHAGRSRCAPYSPVAITTWLTAFISGSGIRHAANPRSRSAIYLEPEAGRYERPVPRKSIRRDSVVHPRGSSSNA